jgi:hypothetical protein
MVYMYKRKLGMNQNGLSPIIVMMCIVPASWGKDFTFREGIRAKDDLIVFRISLI